MYWCKIARNESEFEAIAKLNYETFVEEIPQHEQHHSGKRTDAFHHENTYLIVLKGQQLVGMIALRDQRPFSLDRKIGPVENSLPQEALKGKLCEIRLLSVRKEHRNGRVFFLLARALADYAYEKGYGAAVISGTVREMKLYGQLGFQAFAHTVGSEEAAFVPMFLTKERYEQSIAARFQQKRHMFYPGPNELTKELKIAFQQSPISHRSVEFTELLKRVQSRLTEMTGATQVHLLAGSGTLANEAMIAQISRLQSKGLILINGAFGERLRKQAQKWNLKFETIEEEWGTPFNFSEIKNTIQTGTYGWVLLVHGETSTGMLNDFQDILAVCKGQQVHLCMDCISSIGAVPFSLQDVYLATGVSGKAIGTMTGLAMVYSNHEIEESSSIPSYLDLGSYANGRIPYTYSSQLLKSLEIALKAYHNEARYTVLNERYQNLLHVEASGELEFLTKQGYPMIVTLTMQQIGKYLSLDARLSGFDLHDQSAYLKDRQWVQISLIQPNFEESFEKFHLWLRNYINYENKQ
ncbi:GNAT family N-acetyltransferase [Paenisporosarcina indica]|uniref:GNAT family N-acetyltransferase n=1 Tax=Paenisporosarcina indica TaxID=650093 RepID=UPI0009502FF4|nr:GNAT family N-acetyltransferase [Paenisporosarcina indica]